ncbi:YggT family protein, partial [Klebsiella pneumoniae]
QTLGSLYLLIVLMRFILQLVRANFYNPLCQFVVKATQPLLKPLRRVIPSLFGLDMSSLVLALLLQILLFVVILMLNGYQAFTVLLLPWGLIGIFSLFLKIIFWSMIISVI